MMNDMVSQHTHELTTEWGNPRECNGAEDLLRLLLITKTLSPHIQDVINVKAKNLLHELTPDIANFLSNDLSDEVHTEEDIRTVIQCVPGALSYEDEDGRLPIENAAWRYNSNNTLMDASAVSFIPVLAEEGIKNNVGGKESRGALLRDDEDGCNVLNHLSRISENDCDIDHESFDLRYLDCIKRLRQMGLFRKKDIENHDLLWDSCDYIRSQRFNYFADWNPELLIESRDEGGDSVLHWCSSLGDIYTFETVLRTMLRHYPQELGLLLDQNDQGITPFQNAYREFGEEAAWKTIKKCLDESELWKSTFHKDAEPNVLPIIFAAEGDASELDVIFSLIQHDPIVLDQCVINNDNAKAIPTRKRKNEEFTHTYPYIFL
jgi:hypothetical protein